MATDEFVEEQGHSAARRTAEIAEAERRERERLAEALHDDALQRLLTIRQDLVEAADDPAVLRSVQRQLDELTESLRSLTVAMHEETLDAVPLGTALERLADDGARRGRLVVRTHVDPAAAGDHDPFVLGVARELLANVVKHADAGLVELSVTAAGDAVVVRVSDDGRGLTGDDIERAGRAGHLGHARLGRRLATVGGTLEIDSAPLAGTVVTCTLPLENLRSQRTLEEALRRERRWSAALVAAMQDGFVVFRDGVAVQVNDRFCAMTGFTREELVGGGAGGSPFWPPEHRERFAELVHDARSPGGAQTRSLLLRRDGSRFPALVAGRGIHDDEGGDAGTLITVKDVAELELAAEREHLEHELATVVATTNRLRDLLAAARAVSDEDGLAALLDEIARTISEELGWAVVINLYRPAQDDFVATTAHGLPPEGWALLRGAAYEWAEWTPLLDERFARRGAFLVPEGEPALAHGGGAVWTPRIVPLDAPDAWRADDHLLIPFAHTEGHLLGILSLDAPASGRRPSDAELDVLVAIAAHAGLAVQHAQTAIESARHVAALDRLLHVSSRIAGTREIDPMLDVVAGAIAEALDFERVVVEVTEGDGFLRPRAIRDDATPPLGAAALAPLPVDGLTRLLDPGFAVEGCFLFSRDEARERMPAERAALLDSRRNGSGWRAWDDHLILVPLRGPEGRVAGVVWAGEPVDRLLPGSARLQALHAFANQATAAMIAAERAARLELVADADRTSGLGDRHRFLRELDREVARAARTGVASVLVLAEVEGCAALHEAADGEKTAGAHPTLAELTGVFESELRRHDSAFRIEGTLFAMLLTGGQRRPQTTAVTLRIAARMRALSAREGVRLHFGIAAVGPLPDGPDDVLRRAATSLLEARRASVRARGG